MLSIPSDDYDFDGAGTGFRPVVPEVYLDKIANFDKLTLQAQTISKTDWQ
jgi:hypothetical protein